MRSAVPLDGAAAKIRIPLPAIAAALAFLVLFWTPMATLLRDWWHDPEVGHGLLLGPLSLWFMWRRRIVADAAPQVVLGVVILVGAVVLRYAAGLAADPFTLRLSLWLAIVGLTVFLW